MPMSKRFALIGGRNMSVFDIDQITEDKSSFIEDDQQSAVIINRDGSDVILPVRTGTSFEKPGYYISPNNPFGFIRYPETQEEKQMYIPDEDCIVDFTKQKTIQSQLEKLDKMNNIMNQYLETPTDGSNTFRPPLSDLDSAEMRGLKQSIIAKNIDMDKYAERFGPNYPNDKRKMKDSSITSFLLKRACKNLDISVDLVFRDASSNVPNPMGKTITINMVPGISNDIDIRENEVIDEE